MSRYDSLVVRVLNGLADGDKQIQPLAGREIVAVTKIGDRDPLNQLHDEVRTTGFGRSPIQHMDDVLVIHHRQGLAFRLETGDHLPRVHPRLDDLQSHPAADRLTLLGHEDHAHAAFANFLQQLVAADGYAGAFGDRLLGGGGHHGRWRSEQVTRIRMSPKQGLYSFPDFRSILASLIEVIRTLRVGFPLD
jgi:hypothetical protein